jgi:hypothetical protein
MTSRLIRRIAIALLAPYAFGQASVALAACGMDREAMAQAMAMPAGDMCDDCVEAGTDSVTALCVAHCTADLQVAGTAPDVGVAPATTASMLVVAVPRFRSPPLLGPVPPGAPPRRILLHSFQI